MRGASTGGFAGAPRVVLARGGAAGARRAPGMFWPEGHGGCFCRGRGTFAGKSVRLRAPGVSPGTEEFWPEGRGGCTNFGYDKYHENYYYFFMAKMFSFLFIMLIYNSANLSFLLYELAYFESSLHFYIFFDKFYVFLSFFNDTFARFIVYLANHMFHYPIG